MLLYNIIDISVNQWDHWCIKDFKKIYDFLNHINPSKVQILLNMLTDNFDNIDINKEVFIVSTAKENPSYEALCKLANQYPDVQFICLADINFYNYPLPSNLITFKFRHWNQFIKIFLDKYKCNVVPVKSKKIQKKFSSLSFFRKQNRALVTASLLTHAKDQSIVSWHNITLTQHQDQLIQSLVDYPKFNDLNWQTITQPLLIDDYNFKANHSVKNINNFSNFVYQTSLINFSNETTHCGWYQDQNTSYLRPGPFLTEKTLNPLIAGNILFNSGSPLVYDFLINDYNIPINYSFDIEFDSELGDLDRFELINNQIQELASVPLQELIDKNIDNLELVQNTITNPDYLQQFEKFNQSQSDAIVEFVTKLTG